MATKPRPATPAKKAPAKKAPAKKAPPARKVAQRDSKKRPSSLDGLEAGPLPEEGLTDLSTRPTSTPGVYLNRAGVLVDRNGVALSFKDVVRRDRDTLREVLDAEVDSPAKLLKAVAMDPRYPMPTRMLAAKDAAPYFDRKMPTALDGGLDSSGVPVPLFDTSKLQALNSKELATLQALLEKAGAAK